MPGHHSTYRVDMYVSNSILLKKRLIIGCSSKLAVHSDVHVTIFHVMSVSRHLPIPSLSCHFVALHFICLSLNDDKSNNCSALIKFSHKIFQMVEVNRNK